MNCSNINGRRYRNHRHSLFQHRFWRADNFVAPFPSEAGLRHQPPSSAGARGLGPAGESIARFSPWKLNPPVYSGNSVTVRSLRSGFGDVFADGTQQGPIANPSLSYVQIKSPGYTDGEIETHQNAYQFLRSALNSEVDRGIMLRAHSTTEA